MEFWRVGIALLELIIIKGQILRKCVWGGGGDFITVQNGLFISFLFMCIVCRARSSRDSERVQICLFKSMMLM